MKTFPAIVLLAAFAGFAFAQNPHRNQWGRHSLSVNSNNNTVSDACPDHLNVWADDYDGHARGEEERVLANQPLTVTASRNGGIHVKQWSRNEIGIKVCKAAVASTNTQAENRVKQIALNVQGNQVTVNGPSEDSNAGNWAAVILIHVPQNASLDLSAHNGGISVNQVSANVTAHTVNGGIALTRSSGKLDVDAQNGGISIKDCSGDVKAEVQNGGLSILLAEDWKGAGMDAHTHNGGLVVGIPRGFRSSLQIAASSHNPITCVGSACEMGNRSWDNDQRTFRIGGGSAIIRTSSGNGGIVIKERGVKSDRVHDRGGDNDDDDE